MKCCANCKYFELAKISFEYGTMNDIGGKCLYPLPIALPQSIIKAAYVYGHFNGQECPVYEPKEEGVK
jgi:hypothetical protein